MRTVAGPTYYCRTGKSFKGHLKEKFLLVDCAVVMSGSYRYDQWVSLSPGPSRLVLPRGPTSYKTLLATVYQPKSLQIPDYPTGALSLCGPTSSP